MYSNIMMVGKIRDFAHASSCSQSTSRVILSEAKDPSNPKVSRQSTKQVFVIDICGIAPPRICGIDAGDLAQEGKVGRYREVYGLCYFGLSLRQE